jgi:osmotically-inducible protein OsmY
MKTDNQLQQDISAELSWEPSVHAAQIGVEVKNGMVTLAGDVGTFAEKWNAERATQRVIGVKSVASELKVKLSGLGIRSDADIASAARTALEWSADVPPEAIKVQVDDGWVTLTGNVEWQFQRQAAADNVRYLLGVTGVSDQIAIKPSLSATLVKADIEAALKRRAVADANEISVAVSGSEVTLKGTVHSWAERDLATTSAWGTPGVREVVDKLTLVY